MFLNKFKTNIANIMKSRKKSGLMMQCTLPVTHHTCCDVTDLVKMAVLVIVFYYFQPSIFKRIISSNF